MLALPGNNLWLNGLRIRDSSNIFQATMHFLILFIFLALFRVYSFQSFRKNGGEGDKQHMKADNWFLGEGSFFIFPIFPLSFICMFACVGTYVYMHMLMLEIDVGNCLYHSDFHIIHWGRSLSPSQNSLIELPSLLWDFLSTSSEDGVTGKLPHPPIIYMGPRNPNLDPHAYVETALTLNCLCSTHPITSHG